MWGDRNPHGSQLLLAVAAAATKGKKSVDRKSQQILGKDEEERVCDAANQNSSLWCRQHGATNQWHT